MKLLVSLLILLFSISGTAQLQSNLNQYMLNQSVINPGFIDINSWYSANVSMRRQWMSIDGAPLTYLANGHYTVNRATGVAMMMSTEKINDVRRSEFSASYAHRIWFGKKMALGLGLKAGYQQYSTGGEYVYFSGVTDPTLQRLSWGGLCVGTGLSLQSRDFDFGFSFPSIIGNALSKPGRDDLVAFNNIYTTLGYKFRLYDLIVIYPTLLTKVVQGARPSVSFDTHMLYNQFLWIGGGYRSDNTLSASLGVFLDKGFRIVYTFESSYFTQHNRHESTHEITLCLSRPNVSNPFSERTYRSRGGGHKNKPFKRK